RAEPEARKPKRFAFGAQAHRGMDVAGERIAAARCAGLVIEDERPHALARIDAPRAPLGRWVARLPVMVAADDGDLQLFALRAPPRETRKRVFGAGFLRVEKISEEHHASGAGLVDRPAEA